MTDLERTILIDKYLSHEMSEEDKNNFERLLLSPDLSLNGRLTFREEVELQKEIENAIRERGLREMLRKENERISRKKRAKRITMWSLSGVFATAVAAVVLVLLIVAPIARTMNDYSTHYVANLSIGALRGDSEYADRLNAALQSMQNGEWDEASVVLDELMEQTAGGQIPSMIDVYDSAEWFKALCLMHDGKVLKAKRLLHKIADSKSYYNVQAAELLEQL